MSTVEIEISGAELEAGDIIVSRFGARTVTEITSRTVYTTFYHTEFCRECNCSNAATLTVRRAS